MEPTPATPTEEKRPLTESEIFRETRTNLSMRYRQVVEIMRSGKDALYQELVELNTSTTRDELELHRFNLADGLSSIVDILNRLNAGIMLPASEAPKESRIEVVR